MALEDVVLPKEYANARVLFEQNLDAWREAAEESFFTINLNLTQLSKDCFVAGYEFDNDGVANLSQSLEQRINLLAAGATPISGTSSDTFTVNSDGNSGTLSTLSLTDIRTFTFPDLSGVFVLTTGVQNLTSKTFTDNLVFNSGTAFTGTFDHANSANRIWTLPDVAGTLLVIGQADWDSLWTDAVHDHSSNAEGGTSLSGVTLSGTTTVDGPILLPTSAPAANRSLALVSGVLQAHDGSSAKPYLRTNGLTTNTYNTANIDIGATTDGAFADVDATNAALTVSVGVAGYYLVIFKFTLEVDGVINTALQTNTAFRLVSPTENGTRFQAGVLMQLATGVPGLNVPVTITQVFNLVAGSNLIKLQKQNLLSVNIGSRSIHCADVNVEDLYKVAFRVADV